MKTPICTVCFALYRFYCYTVTRKQAKFTLIAKTANSITENFIKAVNSEDSITNHSTIKDLNSTFSDIGNPFSLFYLNINALSFQSDELESLISKSQITLK